MTYWDCLGVLTRALQAGEKLCTLQGSNTSGAKALISALGYGPTKSRALIQNRRAVTRPAVIEIAKLGCSHQG